MKNYKIFSDNIEEKTLDQFYDAINQDYVVKAALMPDAHFGYSLPIGAVVATKDVIVPSWVGYDIGCGMCALKINIDPSKVRDKADEIFEEVYRKVPVGQNHNKEAIETKLDPKDLKELGLDAFKSRRGFLHLGSLGSGNHFIEIGTHDDDSTWVIIHSGSRGVGHGIATNYIRLASGCGKVKEGHFGLDTNSEDGKSYINDLNWALQFALENRKEIMRRVVSIVEELCDGGAPSENWDSIINRNHNHSEEKDGLWIHRKGATHAEKGMLGVIPGNMRDGSFIIKGKGNPDSLYSSSHGAGRVFSRRKARESLTVEDFKTKMEGITAKVGNSTIDESPDAYKDIFKVMEEQKDLVEVICHVKPIINIKG